MMKKVLSILLLGFLILGCGPKTRTKTKTLTVTKTAPSGTPSISMITTWGAQLTYPIWVELHPAFKDQMLSELAFTPMEAGASIGVPAWASITIVDPGPYYAPSSSTGLALGEWVPPDKIILAWRGCQSGPLLPALAHELRHLITQDPLAGH